MSNTPISVSFLITLLVLLHGCQSSPVGDGAAATARGTSQADYSYPRHRMVDGLEVVIHAPQIRAWPDFKRFEAQVAIEVSAPGSGETGYGTATVSGATELDMARRVVRIQSPVVDSVRFAGTVPANYRDAVEHATRTQFDIPLELFLSHLEEDVLSEPPPPGFNPDPPPIAVRGAPTLLLFINGEPVAAPVEGTGLELIVNANWPLLRTHGEPTSYYLLERGRWLGSAQLDTGWTAVTSLPDDFTRLPDQPQYRAARQAVPPQASAAPVPSVLFVKVPTELIVIDGQPQLETIPEAGALQYVSNTESPLFRLDGDWYYLASGRWFTTADLERDPWRWVAEVPELFGMIPEDHALAYVRVSVPGTPEARMAALEALLPTTVSAAKGAQPPVAVSYAGEPKFETIPGTEVARAVNSGFDVLRYEQHYYLLYKGIWYAGAAPTGPWAATGDVPDAIYRIPPGSPSYQVTQVKVTETTEETVEYSYPAGYSSNVYVAYGVPWYGTGWYYPPYYGYPYYYPYWPSYGYGSWYNPATGSYGSRSVWYGPYGGYSYNQGYNPNTGAYGFVETAWDGDEWASHGETYNPRTGVGTQTNRYYDEHDNRASMERTVQRGDQWVRTDRATDFDNDSMQVNRETSGGGSSEMTRTLEDGTLNSSGSVTTGDGRNYTVSGEATREGGSTTITGADGSADIDTRRDGGNSVSTITGSGGGQGVSVSGDDPGRTTIGKSGSGDVYAGHNGNVYRKTDAGWEHYDNGAWSVMEHQPRAQSTSTIREQGLQPGSSLRAPGSVPLDSYNRQRPSALDDARLQNDYYARQRANRNFEMRRGGFGNLGGSGLRGGGLRGRR